MRDSHFSIGIIFLPGWEIQNSMRQAAICSAERIVSLSTG